MAYLVDTDVLIDVAKGREGARDKKDIDKIDQLVATFSTVPLSSVIGTTAYELLKRFAKSHGLRVFDAVIAATAIEDGRILPTRNQKHFRMIPELNLEVPSY